MKFTLTIDCDNAAFQSAHDDAPEARRYLCAAVEVEKIIGSLDVANSVDTGQRSGFLRDSNGNRCGSWSLNDAD